MGTQGGEVGLEKHTFIIKKKKKKKKISLNNTDLFFNYRAVIWGLMHFVFKHFIQTLLTFS